MKLDKGTYVICDPAIIYPTKVDWDTTDNMLCGYHSNIEWNNPYGQTICVFRSNNSIRCDLLQRTIHTETGFFAVIPIEQIQVEDIYSIEDLKQIRDVIIYEFDEDFHCDYNSNFISINDLIFKNVKI